MKILELGKFYPPYKGGIETLLALFCEGFVRRGHTVDCVVANSGPRTIHEVIRNVRVHRMASLGTAASLSLAPGYLNAARRWAPDLIHVHAPNPLGDLACWIAPRDCPMVLTYHSDVIRQSGLMRIYAPLLRWFLGRVDRVVVATPAHIDHSPWLPAVRSKCRVIPFGIDPGPFELTPVLESAAAGFRSRVGDPSLPVVLVIGRLVGYKGHAVLLRAARQVAARFWIVGTGPLEAGLRQQVRESGLGDRVQFWGEVPEFDRTALLHACELLALPSVTRAEAFGLVQVEAMLCGKPVVSTRLDSGVPWVNLDGKTGLVVPPEDDAALALALNTLLSKPDLADQLGRAGRSRAYSEFTAQVMIDRYAQLFDELIGPPNPGTRANFS